MIYLQEATTGLIMLAGAARKAAIILEISADKERNVLKEQR